MVSIQYVSVLIIILMLFLGLFNIISRTTYWVQCRKNELYIKWVIGAHYSVIKNQLIREFLFLVTFSFLVGYLIFYILSKITNNILLIGTLSIGDLVLSYLVIIIMGIISCIVMLKSISR